MAIPKYYEIHRPFLEAIQDGNEHTLKELKPRIAKYFQLSSDDLAELLPSGRQTVFLNRIGWARTYLKKAGLIDSPARATFKITNAGIMAIAEAPRVIDNNYLMKFSGFQEFQNKKVELQPQQGRQNETPDDLFEESFKNINESLADDVLAEVMKISPVAFEQMVIDLLSKMGYGAFENAGRTTSVTGDEGLDGIIMEDKWLFTSLCG